MTRPAELVREFSCQNLLELAKLENKSYKRRNVLVRVSQNQILVDKLQAMGFNCKNLGIQISKKDFEALRDFIYDMAEKVDFADSYKVKEGIYSYEWTKHYITDIYFAWVQKFME